MKNKLSIVVTAVVVIMLVLWYLVRIGKVSNPMWNTNTNKVYNDALETFGKATDVNIAPGGGAIWGTNDIKGLHLLNIMDKSIPTCCPIPSDGVVRAQVKVQIRHPYIATAIMSLNPEITINQGKSTVEVRCASVGCALVLLSYIMSMAYMDFNQFIARYQLPAGNTSSFNYEANAQLNTIMNLWKNGNMEQYNIVKLNAKKKIEEMEKSIPKSLGACKDNSCTDNVFTYNRFNEAPSAVLADEGFTTDRVFLEEGEYIEGFMHRPKDNVSQKYVTYRHMNSDRPQLPAYNYTTLGGGSYPCGDGIVGCTLQHPMFRVAKTHEINSCANPKTMYSIEPVSVRNPRDQFALGEKSYPLFDNQTYYRLTHSMYSPNLPTRTAK